MSKLALTAVTAGLLGFAFATSAAAQQSAPDFPREATTPASCESVSWNDSMLRNHPRLIDACQEVIVVDGESWARFDAKFVQIERDGDVVFSVRDRRDRSVEEVLLTPATGQVAYINDRATPFRQLRTTDSISLYVPEGEYGFATRPGVPPEQVAVVAPRPAEAPRQTPAPVEREQAVAQRATRPAVLPATASSLPWLALAGFLAMFSGMILTMRRWF